MMHQFHQRQESKQRSAERSPRARPSTVRLYGNVLSTLRRPCLLAMLALQVTSWSPAASASPALANRYVCVACHQPDKKVVGPSWNDIGKRYADGSKTADQLAAAIRKGGSGTWGTMAMPPQAAVSEADAKALAEWILSQGK